MDFYKSLEKWLEKEVKAVDKASKNCVGGDAYYEGVSDTLHDVLKMLKTKKLLRGLSEDEI